MATTSLTCVLFVLLFLLSITDANPLGLRARADKFPGCSKWAENFRFYAHTVFYGKDATNKRIAGPWMKGFGFTQVADKPLTKDTNPNSTPLGKLQALYSWTDKRMVGIFMAANFVFSTSPAPDSGKTTYISVQGRVSNNNDVNEIYIVGGARNMNCSRAAMFAQKISQQSKSLVVEYNLCCQH